MVTLDEFEQIAKEELDLLPDYVLRDLDGGVLIDPAAYLHPKRLADDLYILGTYSYGSVFGNQIVLYYGSFNAVMGYADRERIRMQVRETLRHEFLHHLEFSAGLGWKGTLVEEDHDRLMKYYLRHRETQEASSVLRNENSN